MASAPMAKASGIDAQDPCFDGVEVLKEKEIGSVSVQEAKADSIFHANDRQNGGVIDQCAEIAIVGAGMAGLMKSVGDAFSK